MTRLLFVTWGHLIVGAPWPAPPHTPSFTTRVEAVRVDVLVTDHGLPVRGLQASDFEILDNGVSGKLHGVELS